MLRPQPPRKTSGIGIAAALLLLSLLALPTLALRAPTANQEVAILFAPGTEHEEAFRAVIGAGGLSTREGGWPNVIVARFPEPLGWSGLWKMGALVALDPLAFGACFVSEGD